MQRQWVHAFVLGLALVPAMERPARAQAIPVELEDEELETGGDAEVADAADEPSSAAVEATDDEELAQLVSQAEQLVAADGRASAGEIARLVAALEALQAALVRKAGVLEESPGGDTAEADEQVEASGTELQSLLSEPDEETSDEEANDEGDGGPFQEGEPEASAGAGLGQAREFVDLVLGSLERIQALRSTLRSESRVQGELAEEESGQEMEEGDDDVAAGSQGASEAESTDEGESESEEELGAVTGVITRDGEPVEGAVVTDEGSGARAVSDRLGLYTLEGLPPDAQAHLKVLLANQTVASGRTEVVRGRSAIADFPLGGPRSPMALRSQRQGARVLASVVGAPRSAGPTGAVHAEVRDATGRAVPRALVRLGSGSVARTDSRGRCTFTHVPVGTHELSTPGSAGKVVSQRVVVKARQANQAMLRVAPHTLLARSLAVGKPLPGTLTGILRGTVRDATGHVVAGARVFASPSAAAARGRSAVTTAKGAFELRGLIAGSYRVAVTKAGYQTANRTVPVEAGKRATADLRLSAMGSWELQQAIPKLRAALGQIRGQVRGANHGAVSGARVELRKAGRAGLVASAVSDRRGEFVLAALPGTYEMKVQRSTFRSAASSVKVSAGGVARPQVVLAAVGTTPGVSQRNGKLVAGTAGRDTRDTRSPPNRETSGNSGSVAFKRGTVPSVQGRPARADLRGQVIDLATGKAIAGATISVDGRSRGTTDSRGGFAITGLEPGAHRVKAARAGFSPGERSVTLYAGKTGSVTVGLRSVAAPPAKRSRGTARRPPGRIPR